MAHNQEGFRVPMTAASAIGQYVPFTLLPAASAIDETGYRAGSINDYPLGFTTATGASPGDPISVQVDGVVKGRAGASIGVGALVGVGCVNGILIPVMASGQQASGGPSAGIYLPRFAVGVALKSAAAADWFPVLIRPNQVV